MTRFTKEESRLGVIVIIFLSGSLFLLVWLVFGLNKFARVSAKLIQKRLDFHRRAVTVHENYLTLPSFVNDASVWQKRYEKARIDFDYMLSSLMPDKNGEVEKGALSTQYSQMLKDRAEKGFVELKNKHPYSVDDWSNWLVKFIESNDEKVGKRPYNPTSTSNLMNKSDHVINKSTSTSQRRQKRRIRDEKHFKVRKQRQHRELRNKKSKSSSTS